MEIAGRPRRRLDLYQRPELDIVSYFRELHSRAEHLAYWEHAP